MKKLFRSTFINGFVVLMTLRSYGQVNDEIRRIDSITYIIDKLYKTPIVSFSDSIPVYVCFVDPPASPCVINTVMFFGDVSCQTLQKYVEVFSSIDFLKPNDTVKIKSQYIKYYYDDQLIKVIVKNVSDMGEQAFYFSHAKLIKAALSPKKESIDLKRFEKDYLSEVQSDLDGFKRELKKLKFKEILNY